MAWYNPVDWAQSGYNAVKGGIQTITSDPGAEAERRRRALLYQQAQQAGRFANQAQGNFTGLGLQGQNALAGLQRLAQGQDSVSAEQLRQGLQQNVAAQRSLAASASPRNAAAAARTAAIQSGRLGAGLAGQQALAGLQERQQAQQQYAGLLQGLRGQDLQATLGSRQTAVQGYGAGNAGEPEKSWLEKYGPSITGGLGALAQFSDRRLKTDVRDGYGAATRAIDSLSPMSYRYRDPALGGDRQLGVMAQDLERAGLGHAVINTPRGKMVKGATLATANTGMIAALARRVGKLEGKRGK